MKLLRYSFAACFLVVFPAVSHAQNVFRHQDEAGHVTFSDQASKGGERHQLPDYQQQHTVVYVYDGDTVKLENGTKVRLIGIDAPEVASRYRKATAGGNDAKQWLKQHLQDQQIIVRYDQEKRDKYGRTLAHLYTLEGDYINAEIVAAGWAMVSFYPPNLLHSDELVQAQQQAMQAQLGVWQMKRYQLRTADKVNKAVGWRRFSGKVEAIKRYRKSVRLTINSKLSVKIAKQHLNLFDSLESYVGKSVEIHGWVTGKRPPFTMTIRHPSALIVQ